MPEQKKTGLFLGFDFGTKRIGIAIGQRLLQTASALTVLRARDGVPDWQELDRLMQTWQPEALVVGIPLHMDGSESDMTFRARRFARKLEKRYALPVHGTDERLTSEAAASLQRDQGRHSGVLDAEAAALALQGFLDHTQ